MDKTASLAERQALYGHEVWFFPSDGSQKEAGKLVTFGQGKGPQFAVHRNDAPEGALVWVDQIQPVNGGQRKSD